MDAPVAPGRVLPRETQDQLAGLDGGGWSAGPVRVGPMLGDESSMPTQDRVRRDNSRDLPQHLPTQPVSTHSQPTSIVICELEPLTTQLASKDPIFFHQKRDRLALTAI